MITCSFEDGNKNSLRHVVADALVIKNNKVLMVKRAGKLLEGGKWALAGGFADRDESISEAIEREVMEETGWKVKNIRLLTIIDNPDRPKENHRQNVSFVYICEADKKVAEADDESDDQRWFALDSLPPKEQIAFDHAGNIDLYKRFLKEDLTLPILPQFNT